jgi:hypothetical protein
MNNGAPAVRQTVLTSTPHAASKSEVSATKPAPQSNGKAKKGEGDSDDRPRDRKHALP